MIRSFAIAAAAFAFSAPALAADSAAPASDSTSVAKQQLAYTSAALQARQHLVRQGYINVSELEQDASGRWTGTALKDGKTVIVGIKLPAVGEATN